MRRAREWSELPAKQRQDVVDKLEYQRWRAERFANIPKLSPEAVTGFTERERLYAAAIRALKDTAKKRSKRR